MDEDHVQRVRDRAHALWEQAGRPEGQDAEHWSQAEREIAAEEEAQFSAPSGAIGARRGRKPKAAGEVSADAPRPTRGRKPKAVTEEGAEAPEGTRGRKAPAAAGGEGDAPKPRRGRKPKVAPEGSGTAE